MTKQKQTKQHHIKSPRGLWSQVKGQTKIRTLNEEVQQRSESPTHKVTVASPWSQAYREEAH